ncbi:hypothetical protein, partial [Nocardia cyriacigeorgica]|uniref:hypothetical protein n=1 Tax=Nocardia cyriacigeorgica TaxID=135487 RepID=UPI0024557CD6
MNSRMNNCVAFAVLVALVVAVAAGWFAAPGSTDSPSSAGPDLPSASGFATENPAPAYPVDQQRQHVSAYDTALTAASRRTTFDGAALILAFLIAGAAAIGAVFFSPAPIRGAPCKPRGPGNGGGGGRQRGGRGGGS